MTQSSGVSRRGFLAAGAAVAGTAAFSAKSYAQIVGANERLNLGMIGCGGMAGSHLAALLKMKDEENIAITTVCDLYGKRAKGFQERINAEGGDAKILASHEELLAMKDIDYVVIATPEHSHHRVSMDAMKAGKHVYCEKPICHNIEEAKEVVAKAKETGVKFQVGVQATADDSYSSALDAIREGKIGPVVQAQIDYVRNHAVDSGPWRVKLDDAMPKPDDLDWETWRLPLDPAPWDPHHYFEWRCYREYSGGVATDLFIHRVTRLIKACGLTYPTYAVGMGGITMWDDGRDLPDNFEMLLEYPAVEGITPGMSIHMLGSMANANGITHCIRGHKATLNFTDAGWEIVEERTKKVLASHKKTGGEDVTPHHKNHHAAIRRGAPLNCPPELGLYGLVAARMGNLSWFQRKLMLWDAKGEFVRTA